MSEPRQVPGPVADNNERIQARGYPDFAALPDDEVVAHVPGGGGSGTPTMGINNTPLIIVAIGLLVLFVTFFGGGAITLVLGLLLLLVGAAWSAVRGRTKGASGRGIGPATFGGR